MSKSFKTFTPSDIKAIISRLPNDEQETLQHFIAKLIDRKSRYCGHCGVLVECSGPCNMKNGFYYGCVCGVVCYNCEKGDNYDSPCPKASSEQEIKEYWGSRKIKHY